MPENVNVDQIAVARFRCVGRGLMRRAIVVIAQLAEVRADFIRDHQAVQDRIIGEEAAVVGVDAQGRVALVDRLEQPAEVVPDRTRVVRVAVFKRLADRFGGEQPAIVGKTTVNHWLPGSVEVFTPEFFRNPPDLPPGEVATAADSLSLPADMPTGKYTVSLAVVNQSERPMVRLAINGRADDGWYPLGKVAVGK